jgi:hypothetical protein
MNDTKKFTWVVYGPQSITAVLNEMDRVVSVPDKIRFQLSNELIRKFHSLRFGVECNTMTGDITAITFLPDEF